MGIFWLSIIPLIIIAYMRPISMTSPLRILGILGAIYCLLMLVVLAIVGFIFTNNMSLMLTTGKLEPLVYPGIWDITKPC